MAFEKECDFVLRLLSETMGEYHLAAINHNLKSNGFNVEANELISLISILSNNEHIYIRDPIRITIENNKTEYHGGIAISQKGVTFIVNSSYENEKSKNDLLLDITVSNAQIQSRLLNINRLIAASTGIAAIYYLQEIAKNCNYPLQILLAFCFVFLSGGVFGMSIWKLLEILQKRKQEKNVK